LDDADFEQWIMDNLNNNELGTAWLIRVVATVLAGGE